jgi:hypothetical protein
MKRCATALLAGRAKRVVMWPPSIYNIGACSKPLTQMTTICFTKYYIGMNTRIEFNVFGKHISLLTSRENISAYLNAGAAIGVSNFTTKSV